MLQSTTINHPMMQKICAAHQACSNEFLAQQRVTGKSASLLSTHLDCNPEPTGSESRVLRAPNPTVQKRNPPAAILAYRDESRQVVPSSRWSCEPCCSGLRAAILCVKNRVGCWSAVGWWSLSRWSLTPLFSFLIVRSSSSFVTSSAAVALSRPLKLHTAVKPLYGTHICPVVSFSVLRVDLLIVFYVPLFPFFFFFLFFLFFLSFSFFSVGSAGF